MHSKQTISLLLLKQLIKELTFDSINDTPTPISQLNYSSGKHQLLSAGLLPTLSSASPLAHPDPAATQCVDVLPSSPGYGKNSSVGGGGYDLKGRYLSSEIYRIKLIN